MKEAEKKLIIATKERTKTSRACSISTWMDIFINKGSEIEHEAFLLHGYQYLFFHKNAYKRKVLCFQSLFNLQGEILLHWDLLFVLASIYKDLRVFKEAFFFLETRFLNFFIILYSF
jgi:hypothetical protein